ITAKANRQLPCRMHQTTSGGATLDAQVLQALSHVQPAPDLPSPRGRNLPAAPASAPAASPKDRKPAVKPNPKPAPKPARAAP
ncbi:hypothetical protein ACQCQB_12050, partial [Ralstonia pseudosolanacearum]